MMVVGTPVLLLGFKSTTFGSGTLVLLLSGRRIDNWLLIGSGTVVLLLNGRRIGRYNCLVDT